MLFLVVDTMLFLYKIQDFMFMGRDGEVIAHYFGYGSHLQRLTCWLSEDKF
jgi:hypothetical protein